MTNVQLSLIQIDNYGPWTVTPQPRREMDLQTLQSRVFADIAQFIGNRRGYAFLARADNMVAVTNGLDHQDHELLQESIANRYPVTISIGIGTGEEPIAALEDATNQIQTVGSAQDQSRREVLAGITRKRTTSRDVQIAHFDVNNATSRYTDQLNAFDSFIVIQRAYATLMQHLREQYSGLSFFVGGDNIISIVPEITTDDYQEIIQYVASTAEVNLKVGVGCGSDAAEAGISAKYALETCRHREIAIHINDDGVNLSSKEV